MPKEELIYVVGAANETERLLACLSLPGLCCRVFHSGSAALRDARQELPRVLFCVTGPNESEFTLFCRRLKADALLRHCWLALVCDAAKGLPAFHADGGEPDEILPANSSPSELQNRLRIGLKVSRLVESNQRLQHELDRLRLEQQQDSLFTRDTTTQLVEIAAELHGEITRSAEMEQAHIMSARTDTIAQAAAALRHEINNPLFAIVGSAEAAVRRLDNLAEQVSVDLSGICGCLDRIQRGASRIQQVVGTISDMLMPTTTDYLPGVEMLDLRPSE